MKATIKIENNGSEVTVEIDGETFDLGYHPNASRSDKEKLALVAEYINDADLTEYDNGEWFSVTI